LLATDETCLIGYLVVRGRGGVWRTSISASMVL